jgi:hypothetical protein
MSYKWFPAVAANTFLSGSRWSQEVEHAPQEVQDLFKLCFTDPIYQRIAWVVEACAEKLRQYVIKVHNYGEPNPEDCITIMRNFHWTVDAAQKFRPPFPQTQTPPQALKDAVRSSYAAVGWIYDKNPAEGRFQGEAPEPMAIFHMMYEFCLQLEMQLPLGLKTDKQQDPEVQLRALRGANVDAAEWNPVGANRGSSDPAGWNVCTSPSNYVCADWGPTPIVRGGPVVTATLWAFHDLLPQCLRCFSLRTAAVI